MSTKRVPTLSQASEFRQWSAQLKAYLQSKGLHAYTTGNATRPDTKIGQEPEHVFTARQVEYDTRMEQTLGIIKTHTITSYFAEISDLVNLAFLDLDDMTLTDAMPTKLIDCWTLAVTLHGLPSDYDTVKVIIQDWSNVDLEKAQAHIHEHKLKLKVITPSYGDSKKLLLAQDKGAHRRGKRGGHKGQHQGSNGSNSHLNHHGHPGQPQWPQPADKGSRPTCAYCHKPGHTNVECYL